jgi:soluble P-type ATPase
MIEIPVPGFKTLRIEHLVLDYNGTLARDGRLIDGVRERLIVLSRSLELHVLTADTHGNVVREIAGIPCGVTVISRENEAESKLAYIHEIGYENVICIGNGRNDRLMLTNASLGIGVIQAEGCAREALLAAQVVATSILDALDLIIHPLRLMATLRS